MTAGTALLTLGRLPVALDLARSFDRAGWRVIVADPLRLTMAHASRAVERVVRVPPPATEPQAYANTVERLIDDERVDLVLPVSEEVMHVAALCDGQRSAERFNCLPAATLHRLHDKYLFPEIAAGVGLPVPETRLGADPAAAELAAAGPTVVKPRHGSAGDGVQFVAAGKLPALPDGVVVQRAVRGRELCGFCLASRGRRLVSLVYRPVVTAGSVAVCFERVDGEPGILSWMDGFVEATGYDGFVGFDFIVADDGTAFALECNPRVTSGIHFIETESLAPAIVDGTVPTLRPETRLTESYSCYTSVLGAIARPAEARRRWHALRASTDVTWDRADPWPFLTMSVNTLPIMWRALVARRSVAEVSLTDLAWRPA